MSQRGRFFLDSFSLENESERTVPCDSFRAVSVDSSRTSLNDERRMEAHFDDDHRGN